MANAEHKNTLEESRAETYTRRGFLTTAALGVTGAAAYLLSNCENGAYFEGITIEDAEKLGITAKDRMVLWPGGSLAILQGKKTTITRQTDGTICISNGEEARVVAAAIE